MIKKKLILEESVRVQVLATKPDKIATYEIM